MPISKALLAKKLDFLNLRLLFRDYKDDVKDLRNFGTQMVAFLEKEGQKGYAPILMVFVAVAFISLIGGSFFLSKQSSKPISPSQTTQPNPITSPEGMSNWKTYEFSDKKGFGYTIKIPSDWMNGSFAGGGNYDPTELAQNFYGQSCGGNQDRVIVLHYLSNNPQNEVTKLIGTTGMRKDGFTVSNVKLGNSQDAKKLSGYVAGYNDLYVYAASSKGYYQISTRIICDRNLEETFDQILSTFRFTQ